MNIGILLWELNISGGTQRQAIELSKYLMGQGDSVTVYTAHFDPDRCFPDKLHGMNIVSLYTGKGYEGRKNRSRSSRIVGGIRELQMCRRLSRMIGSEVDMLNVHDDLAFPAAVYWKRRRGGKVVWMINDVTGGISPICTGMNDIGETIRKFIDGRAIGHSIYRRYARQMDSVVVLDQINANKYFRSIGVRPKIVRSGLDISNFRFVRRDPPKKEAVSILSTGIFFPHRRLEDLVDAIVILHANDLPVFWKHVGSDRLAPEYAKFIYRRVKEKGLGDHVRFLGPVSEKELIEEYCSAHVFVFPNAPQTWGLAVFEAMSCGTPVVVSKGSGASEVLTHEDNAILVDPYLPEKIATGIARLYRDPALWVRLRDNGRKFVEDNIRWDIYGKNMRAEFARLHAE